MNNALSINASVHARSARAIYGGPRHGVSCEHKQSLRKTKGGERKDRVGHSYLMQGGEAVFIAEVWTHIVLQQVAHWWKRDGEAHE